MITAEDAKSANLVRGELTAQGLYCTRVEKQSEIDHLPGDFHFLATCPSSPHADRDINPALHQSTPTMSIV